MIYRIPKDSYVEVKRYVCEFHQEHPDEPDYAGCTCSASYVLKVGKPDEDAG